MVAPRKKTETSSTKSSSSKSGTWPSFSSIVPINNKSGTTNNQKTTDDHNGGQHSNNNDKTGRNSWSTTTWNPCGLSGSKNLKAQAKAKKETREESVTDAAAKKKQKTKQQQPLTEAWSSLFSSTNKQKNTETSPAPRTNEDAWSLLFSKNNNNDHKTAEKVISTRNEEENGKSTKSTSTTVPSAEDTTTMDGNGGYWETLWNPLDIPVTKRHPAQKNSSTNNTDGREASDMDTNTASKQLQKNKNPLADWPSLFSSKNSRNETQKNTHTDKDRDANSTTPTNRPSEAETTKNDAILDIDSFHSQPEDESGATTTPPKPERLVDFFAIVGLDVMHHKVTPDDCNTTSPADMKLDASVMDCVPNSRQDMEFPHQLPMFCYPSGYKVSRQPRQAKMFTIVLTAASGYRLHGTVATLYEPVYCKEVDDMFSARGLSLPPWMNKKHQSKDIVCYIPKSLVVMSQYPYYALQIKFLSHLVELTNASRTSPLPLPLERYIANFVNDIPLPKWRAGETVYWDGYLSSRQGNNKQKDDNRLVVSRPPPNHLPLANFSYMPLFCCLSVSNILVLWGTLLQEGKVVLYSQHLALLTPVVEALLSLLFPLTWQGIYVPLLPSHMLEVLVDAPLPFLVGVTTDITSHPPDGVVVCNLDQDVVQLGWDDTDSAHRKPRLPPILPPTYTLRLKAELEQVADPLYLIPPCGFKGRITNGDHKEVLDNALREPYCQMSKLREVSLDNDHRHFIFSHAESLQMDGNNSDAQASTYDLLLGGDPLTREPSRIQTPFLAAPANKPKYSSDTDSFVFRRTVQAHTERALSMTGLIPANHATPSEHTKVYNDKEMEERKRKLAQTLYQVDDDMANRVRHCFLRFFVTLLMRYKAFIVPPDGSERSPSSSPNFRHDKFVKSLDVAFNSRPWIDNMVKSQMFERFLHESMVRRFFDDHVIQHLNETVLRSAKGHTPTTFLDKTWPITKVIIPAGPCAMGIPIGRNGFKYDRFPCKLDEEELVTRESMDTMSGFIRSYGCASLWCF